jgi:hypothetical protein
VQRATCDDEHDHSIALRVQAEAAEILIVARTNLGVQAGIDMILIGMLLLLAAQCAGAPRELYSRPAGTSGSRGRGAGSVQGPRGLRARMTMGSDPWCPWEDGGTYA